MKMMKIKFQNSSFCKLLWIRGFLERFSEEFFGGRPLITNFGLNSPPLPGKNLAVLWESLKTGRKHFPIKPVAKEIPNDGAKSCCYQKCFWAVRCKCFGNFYSLSAFARGAFNCSSLRLQNSFANSKALLHFTFNCSRLSYSLKSLFKI